MSYALASVVLPVHDQADHIAQVVEGYEAALSAIDQPYELLLIANACRDRSAEICQGLADAHSSVRVVHTDRGGWGLAVKLGLSHATGDLLCFTNSARTSPEDLSLLLMTARANSPMVVKARREVRDGWKRRLGSFLYNLECRVLFNLPYWDVNGTPKAFPRTFDKLLHLTRDDDLLDAEFNLVVSRERYSMIEVPIRSVRRHGGRSTTNYRSAWNMYLGAYRMAREMRRARR
jgi:glycosyltransferase involved in cell wall biosynthesis